MSRAKDRDVPVESTMLCLMLNGFRITLLIAIDDNSICIYATKYGNLTLKVDTLKPRMDMDIEIEWKFNKKRTSSERNGERAREKKNY